MKTFVRYTPGSGGAFICLLVHSLTHPVEATLKGGSAHDYQHLYSSSHNFDALAHDDCVVRDNNSYNLFKYYTEEEYHTDNPDCAEGIKWFRDRLVFDSSERHVIRTHSRVLNSVIRAVDDANIVNITITEADIDQLCYNFVTKAILTTPGWAKERADDTLPALAYWYPHKSITFEQLERAVKERDVRFLCWIIKYAWKNEWEKYPQYVPPVDFKVFNISWEEFNNRTLVNRLDELANFLNITLTDERNRNATELLSKWDRGQVAIPFSINFDDF